METQTEKKINWKSVLIGVVIGAIIVLLVGFGFWYFTRPKEETSSTKTKTSTSSAKTSTPSASVDETAGWKTYANTTDKYSIKYPPTVNLAEKQPAFFESADYKRQLIESCPPIMLKGWTAKIEGFGNEGTVYKLEDLEKFENENNTTGTLQGQFKITIDGKPATKYVFAGPGLENGCELTSEQTQENIIVVNKLGKGYIITFNYFTAEKEEVVPIVNQMLSTFKFL